MPKELNEILDSLEFEEVGGIVIESVKFIENDVNFIFSIRFDSAVPRQNWQVMVKGVVDECVINEWTQNIDVYEEHVLLLDYIDNHSELYFNGATKNSDALFIALFQSVTQLTDKISHISKYLFSLESVNELSSQGYGLFARGPKTILDVYARCIEKQGIKPIFIGLFTPSHEHKQLRLLEIGNSYFIGESFLFERIV
ncbi:MAG TPA: hypothetical protein VGI43_07250 [Mucilaginibacter sp.]